MSNELWLDGKENKAIKAKETSAVKYKKGTVCNNKKDVQEILDSAVVIEVLSQSAYDDGLEGATIRFRFKNENNI